jgi:hypothetical protein
VTRSAHIWTLAVDAVTAEVTTAFARDGIESLLLKGPSIANWLYDDRSRGYRDSDLLVGPDQLDDARAVLSDLGFQPTFGGLPHPGMESTPAAAWRRGPFSVDLHETLPGASAARSVVWTVLREGAKELPIGGVNVRILGERARLVHIALHAAHHGPAVAQPLRDLRAALVRFGSEEWARARSVAEALDAGPAFEIGLSLLPEGREVCNELGLEPGPSPEWLLRAGGVPLAEGFERLRTAPGMGQRAKILIAELFPSPEFMRWWSPLARRSRRGLAVAYLWRLAFVTARAPAGIRAWRRARRQSRLFG